MSVFGLVSSDSSDMSSIQSFFPVFHLALLDNNCSVFKFHQKVAKYISVGSLPVFNFPLSAYAFIFFFEQQL